MNLIWLLLCLLCLLTPAITASDNVAIASSNRKSQRNKPKSMRVVKSKPTIYISFERTGKREPLRNGESDVGVWLRLHNNTRWAIMLDMNDVPSKKYGDAILFYEVLSDDKVILDARCHVCSVNKLFPGQSLEFSIPLEYIKPSQDLGKELALRISFNYEWEADENGSTSLEPQHFVYFYSSNLSKH